MIKSFLIVSLLTISATNFIYGQESGELKKSIEGITDGLDDLNHRMDEIEKKSDDILWYNLVGDITSIEKVHIPGPPLAVIGDTNKVGAKNPLLFYSYIFTPKNIDKTKKYPLIVFPHGGVHSNFNTFYARTVREFVAQGYIVVAPEYRGSSGYGKDMFDAIDYGGLEVEDVYLSKKYMLDNFSYVDKDRVGIFGWSHGGMLSLLNILKYPNDYKVAYSGEPVTDLGYRMSYKSKSYQKIFSSKSHIGFTVAENPQEYKRRSPIFYADKLKTPLLIHATTNDEDVSVVEAEMMIKELKDKGKTFEYEIYKNIAGGHNFDRIDTKESKEIQLKVFKFLAKYLTPAKPFLTIKDLEKAGYK